MECKILQPNLVWDNHLGLCDARSLYNPNGALSIADNYPEPLVLKGNAPTLLYILTIGTNHHHAVSGDCPLSGHDPPYKVV